MGVYTGYDSDKSFDVGAQFIYPSNSKRQLGVLRRGPVREMIRFALDGMPPRATAAAERLENGGYIRKKDLASGDPCRRLIDEDGNLVPGILSLLSSVAGARFRTRRRVGASTTLN